MGGTHLQNPSMSQHKDTKPLALTTISLNPVKKPQYVQKTPLVN